ncbi:unnamed protein product [Adineta ricciae]|uniref:Uncharacterized protein n=1 Tax=Adineta ricciae TaxID=249248 RepID=A0A813WS62_ADIRI|nr:unnamed protein product [Adineta ricciae]
MYSSELRHAQVDHSSDWIRWNLSRLRFSSSRFQQVPTGSLPPDSGRNCAENIRSVPDRFQLESASRSDSESTKENYCHGGSARPEQVLSNLPCLLHDEYDEVYLDPFQIDENKINRVLRSGVRLCQPMDINIDMDDRAGFPG